MNPIVFGEFVMELEHQVDELTSRSTSSIQMSEKEARITSAKHSESVSLMARLPDISRQDSVYHTWHGARPSLTP